MIWISWRQFRGQAYVALGLVAVLGITLAITGKGLANYYDTTVSTCASRGDCGVAINTLLDKQRFLQVLTENFLIVLVPAVIGIFWGAPLVARELETGTQRLAWTQSVTRTRWLAVKIGIVGLASMAAAGLLSLMLTWWAHPFDRVERHRFVPDIFSERNIVPVGYAAFAFMFGVTAGMLIRRTLPAMATTLFGFAILRVVTTLWVRPRLMPPLHKTAALDASHIGFEIRGPNGAISLHPQPIDLPNAWILSTHIVNNTNHRLTSEVFASTCPGVGLPRPPQGGGPAQAVPVPDGTKDALQACVAKIGQTYHVVTTYQPANRFWTFQALETGIFLGLSLLLAGFCFWWIRRRLN